MLFTLFLAVVFCAAITMLLIAAVAFVQDTKFFSSAPKEAVALLRPRNEELFYGARTMGWVLIVRRRRCGGDLGRISQRIFIRAVLPAVCPDLYHLQGV